MPARHSRPAAVVVILSQVALSLHHSCLGPRCSPEITELWRGVVTSRCPQQGALLLNETRPPNSAARDLPPPSSCTVPSASNCPKLFSPRHTTLPTSLVFLANPVCSSYFKCHFLEQNPKLKSLPVVFPPGLRVPCNCVFIYACVSGSGQGSAVKNLGSEQSLAPRIEFWNGLTQ